MSDDDDQEMRDFDLMAQAIGIYKEATGGTLTTRNLYRQQYRAAAQVMLEAAASKKLMTDNEFLAALGLKPPPEDALT